MSIQVSQVKGDVVELIFNPREEDLRVGETLRIQERDSGGHFGDLTDFCTRVDLRHVGKRTLEMLVKVGAFSSMGTRTRARPTR